MVDSARNGKKDLFTTSAEGIFVMNEYRNVHLAMWIYFLDDFTHYGARLCTTWTQRSTLLQLTLSFSMATAAETIWVLQYFD